MSTDDELSFSELLDWAASMDMAAFVASLADPVLVATGTLALKVLSGDGPRSTGMLEMPSAEGVQERMRKDPQLARIHRVRRRDGKPGPLRVGRIAENDIAIDDSSLSRGHATLEAREGLVHVVDLGSRNGTFLDDARLEPGVPAEARSQSVIRFGRVSLQLFDPRTLYHALKMSVGG